MSRGRIFSFDEACSNTVGRPGACWADVTADFAGEVFPKTQPGFAVRRGETVLALGDGLGRAIEKRLADSGCNAPALEFALPEAEWTGEGPAALGRAHPPAIRQCLEWAGRILDRDGVVSWDDCARMAFACGPDLYADLDLAAGAPVSRARLLERRQQIYKILSAAFSADCLILSPAQIEAWRDAETGLYIHQAPALPEMLDAPERWELEVLSHQQCLTDLLAAIDVVRARNPEVKVLLAASPEPMVATFTGQDVRIAYAHAKSVLRAALADVVSSRSMTDYAPAYEAAVLTHPKLVWDPDRLHLSAGFVAKTARRVQELYLQDGGEAAVSAKTARALLLKNRHVDAEVAARALLRQRPDDFDAAMILVEALIGRFRGDEAETELRPWIERFPDRADLRVTLARAMARSDRGRLPEAILEINSASQMQSMGLAEYRAISEMVRRKAPPTMAEQIMRLAVERFPQEAEVHGYLIEVLADRGKLEEAGELLRKALTLPNPPAIMRLQLADLLIEKGETEEAERLIQSYRAEEPDNDDVQELLGRLRAAGVSR